MKNIVFGIFVALSTLSVGLAQQNDSIVQYFTKNSKEALDAIIVDGDTIPILILDEVLLVDKPSFNSDEARRRYYILRRKVIKVYPYAVIAGNKLDSLNLQLAGISSKRKKKRYIKDFQDYLEGRFEDELKQLTRTEGQILSKLISRETGITTFELIDTYRSGWNAFWWNMAAAFYDIDLKIPYDPTGNEEDKLIENILQRSFINGLLKERVPITTLRPEDIGL
ncbi:DUF4294 domain-containing protein [Owenweeksia hongkongensis]|uniref:DUF4294 domain-containing protein n=1 Tax=Owenweeksia hongkongensis TaxID=253245 RepID=UPI003A92D25B